MRKITVWVVFMFLALGSFTQSFTNIDELLQLSELDPLECEKSLTSKGFWFVETNGLKSRYSTYSEQVAYTVSPRMVQYSTESRIFFLEANSRLIKQGFVLVNTEAEITDEVTDEKTKAKAQEYSKGKLTVWLYTNNDGGETRYRIQIDNSSPAAGKKSVPGSKKDFKYKGDKESVNYGYFSVGLVLPRGIIKEQPKPNTSFNEDFAGLSGIGAKAGFECATGGVLGITPLNNKLPHALDFGILLHGQFSVQPYSYESLGTPYDDYIYTGFMKFGAGAGPAMTLTPFRNADFHLSFYYKLEAGVNFSGTFEYNGSENFEETMVRDAPSFAWVKTYGIHIFGGSLFGGIEFSNYIDKGTFNISQSYFSGNEYVYNDVQVTAALPMRQMALKIGFTF